MTRNLCHYIHELTDFGLGQNFVLGGIWESLDYAPTFTLADRSQLRPLTAQVLLRRSEVEGREQFDVVSYDDLRNTQVLRREPESTWEVTVP